MIRADALRSDLDIAHTDFAASSQLTRRDGTALSGFLTTESERVELEEGARVITRLALRSAEVLARGDYIRDGTQEYQVMLATQIEGAWSYDLQQV